MSRISAAPVRMLLGLASLLSVISVTAQAESVIYSSLPNPLPPNVVSEAYQATQTGQFGNLITFAGTDRSLTGVRLVVSNFSKESDFMSFGSAAGYNVPLTFNIYNVNIDNSVGSLIASQTITALIPWRPETDVACSGNDGYLVGGNCYHGIASLQTFAFNPVGVPDSVIYGLAFNTQTYGTTPTGVAGPYNGLNFGFSNQLPSVGSDISTVGYTDSQTYYGAGGPGVFSQNVGYFDSNGITPVRAAVEFTADVPEPGSVFLMGIGLALVVYSARKRLIA